MRSYSRAWWPGPWSLAGDLVAAPGLAGDLVPVTWWPRLVAWCLWSGGLGHKRLWPVSDPRPGGRDPRAVARALVAG
jgi:hypothetical protein